MEECSRSFQMRRSLSICNSRKCYFNFLNGMVGEMRLRKKVFALFSLNPSSLHETINKTPASASGREETGNCATPVEALGYCLIPRSVGDTSDPKYFTDEPLSPKVYLSAPVTHHVWRRICRAHPELKYSWLPEAPAFLLPFAMVT